MCMVLFSFTSNFSTQKPTHHNESVCAPPPIFYHCLDTMPYLSKSDRCKDKSKRPKTGDHCTEPHWRWFSDALNKYNSIDGQSNIHIPFPLYQQQELFFRITNCCQLAAVLILVSEQLHFVFGQVEGHTVVHDIQQSTRFQVSS